MWWNQEARDASEHATDESYETEDSLKPLGDWYKEEDVAVTARYYANVFDNLFDRLFNQMGRGHTRRQTPRDKQIAVVAALLAKTVERGATLPEAETARNKAHALMKQHGITMRDIVRVIEGGA